MVHLQELCLSFWAQKQTDVHGQSKKSALSCHLGQGYPNPQKRWIHSRQIRQEASTPGNGTTCSQQGSKCGPIFLNRKIITHTLTTYAIGLLQLNSMKYAHIRTQRM